MDTGFPVGAGPGCHLRRSLQARDAGQFTTDTGQSRHSAHGGRAVYQAAQGRIERLLRTTASMIALPAMLMLVLLLVFAGDVLQIVYGDFFRAGAPVLAIMSAGQAINVWTDRRVCCSPCRTSRAG